MEQAYAAIEFDCWAGRTFPVNRKITFRTPRSSIFFAI
jgi:hypothetical protein